MPIFMTHPEHGATHVGSGEVAEHEKNGWKQDTYDNWMAPKRIVKRPGFTKISPNDLDQSGKELAEITDLRAKYEQKFGEKPHHKKSAKTLRKELEE